MKRFIALVLVLFSVSTPLSADCLAQVCGRLPQNIYAGAFAGMDFQDFRFEELNLKASTCMGFMTGAAFGYKYHMFRLEGEASYRSHNYSELKQDGDIVPWNGKRETLGLMVNAYAEFCMMRCFFPYVGFGYGYFSSCSEIRSDVVRDLKIAKSHSSSRGWQAIVGAGQRLYDIGDITVEYRYFQENRHRIGGHSVAFTGKVFF